MNEKENLYTLNLGEIKVTDESKQTFDLAEQCRNLALDRLPASEFQNGSPVQIQPSFNSEEQNFHEGDDAVGQLINSIDFIQEKLEKLKLKNNEHTT